MRPFLQSAAGAFVGKILAAIFIAVCVAVGFGPDAWATFLLGDLSSLARIISRIGFLLLAMTVVCFVIWPKLRPWWRRLGFRWPVTFHNQITTEELSNIVPVDIYPIHDPNARGYPHKLCIAVKNESGKDLLVNPANWEKREASDIARAAIHLPRDRAIMTWVGLHGPIYEIELRQRIGRQAPWHFDSFTHRRRFGQIGDD
jgi:hypothetical protein